MLRLFLSRGIDINARDPYSRGWTALHVVYVVSMGEPSAKVSILLGYDGRIDLRDSDGRTPLDLARLAQQKHPGNSSIAYTIRVLEEAQRKSRS